MINEWAAAHMEPVAGGLATSVWQVHAGSRAYALRVFRAHERHVLERELAVLATARRAGMPVPRVVGVGSYEQRPAVVLEWCKGRPILAALEAEPWRVLALGRAFGRLQAAMHRVAAPRGLRGGWIDWPEPAPPELAARFAALPLVTDRLLHLDYHPLNVLSHAGGITGVLDWTNAHAGDPRADIGRTLTVLRLMPAVQRWDRIRRAFGRLLELGWRSGYGPMGGDLAPFYAWAGGAMLRDLTDRIPASWTLQPVSQWTDHWMRCSCRT